MNIDNKKVIIGVLSLLGASLGVANNLQSADAVPAVQDIGSASSGAGAGKVSTSLKTISWDHMSAQQKAQYLKSNMLKGSSLKSVQLKNNTSVSTQQKN